MKKIGLLFGSFNPVHSGHIHLAEIVLKETNVDEVWFVIMFGGMHNIGDTNKDGNFENDTIKLRF